MMKEKDFLNSWFATLHCKNISYAVLRNYELLPNSCGGSDMDIWINPKDYDSFVKITNECVHMHGGILASFTSDAKCPRVIFQALGWGVQLDVHIGVAMHKGVPYIDNDIIQANIVEYNGIKVLSKEIDAIISFLKEVLNNKKCKDAYCEEAAAIVERLTNAEINEILKAFSPNVRNKLVHVLQNREFEKDSIKKLGIICSNDIRTFTSNIKFYFKQLWKITRVLKQPGYTIAFLGTDGSGKSFIINAVTPILNEAFHNGIRYEHMRPNYLPSLAVAMGKKKADEPSGVCSNPHGSKPSGFAGSIVRLSYYWIDYTWGYFRKVFLDKAFKTHVWIFDRYYYDYYIDQRRARLNLPNWLLKFYGFFVPAPDLTICLGGDPEKIYARKPETSLEEVKRQTKVLKEFASKRKNAVWVDTTATPEESIKNTMDAIIKMMAKRFADTKL